MNSLERAIAVLIIVAVAFMAGTVSVNVVRGMDGSEYMEEMQDTIGSLDVEDPSTADAALVDMWAMTGLPSECVGVHAHFMVMLIVSTEALRMGDNENAVPLLEFLNDELGMPDESDIADCMLAGEGY